MTELPLAPAERPGMFASASTAHTEEVVPSPVGGRFLPRTRQVVRLGSLQVVFVSNESPLTPLRHFPQSVQLSHEAAVHYTVNCCNLTLDGPWPQERLKAEHDRSYRGKRFAAGYYLTDHFGPPAYLITRDRQLWIFAPGFDLILWPFVVKLLLTLHSMDQRMLHLKAAAVLLGDSATLLIGRGGTGKTVLLTQLCQKAGAQFLANTHVLIRDQTVVPVASSIRVRDDVLFGPLIATGKLPAAIKTGEFLADPIVDLGWTISSGGPVGNICLLDYRGPGCQDIRALDREILLHYMESFSLALSIYGLREDVLDHLHSDVKRFSAVCAQMRSQLSSLIERCRCYYISCDVTEPENLRAICAMLRVKHPSLGCPTAT